MRRYASHFGIRTQKANYHSDCDKTTEIISQGKGQAIRKITFEVLHKNNFRTGKRIKRA